MNRTRKNVIANFAGRGWSLLASFIFIPLYVDFLGIEAYGLIGFYAVLQSVLTFADLGLSATLNREIARLSVLEGKEQRMRDLVRTLEIIFWCIAALITAVVISGASLIARNWISAQNLAPVTIETAVRLMGLVIAFQFPSGLYLGGLMGMQRQVLSNGILIFGGFMRGIGAVLILWLVSPTIEAYFLWQTFVNLLQVVLLRSSLWRSLPTSDTRARFKKAALIEVWRYAAGMTGITAITITLTQLDKVVASKALPLETFGYYSLASIVAQVPLLVSRSVTNALFPRLTQLISLGDEGSLSALYHRTCQYVSVLVLPVGMTLMVFSREIMTIWTGNPSTSEQVYPLVILLVAGSICLALQMTPYILALAHGWTKLNLYLGLAQIILVLPLLIALTTRIGAVGACISWLLLNSVSTPIYVHLLHRRFLYGEKGKWYREDVGLPLLASIIPLAIGYWIVPHTLPRLLFVGAIALAAFASILAAALVTPATREAIQHALMMLLNRPLERSDIVEQVHGDHMEDEMEGNMNAPSE